MSCAGNEAGGDHEKDPNNARYRLCWGGSVQRIDQEMRYYNWQTTSFTAGDCRRQKLALWLMTTWPELCTFTFVHVPLWTMERIGACIYSIRLLVFSWVPVFVKLGRYCAFHRGVARICCEEGQSWKVRDGAITANFAAGCSSCSMTISVVTSMQYW